jgi:uncharacterized sulfatase
MELSRRNFTKLSAALMAGTTLAKSQLTTDISFRAGNKKNMILVAVEDLSPVLGCYGDPIAKTPNIDHFAEKSVVFKNAFCQAPVCNPSRTSFITGLRPDTTGISNNEGTWLETMPEVVTFPYCFKQNGYYTGRAGKLFHHQIKNDDAKAWDKTFMTENWTTSRNETSVNFTDGLIDWALYSIVDGPDSNEPDYKLAQFGIDFLRQRPKDEPFFLSVGFFRPHGPYQAPRKYFDLYDLDEFVPPFVPENSNFEHELTFVNMYSPHNEWKKGMEEGMTEKSKREFMQAYYACVSFIDAQFGRLLEEIDSQNLWKDTAIVFVSDHGHHLGENDWWNKNTLFDASARVPLIVYDPDIAKRGEETDGFVELVDMYPSFAQMCKLEAPDNLEGISFVPLLRDPEKKWKKCAYTQVRHKYIGRSVRTQRWRYTKWDNGIEELYDHLSDPGEYRNLIDVQHLHKIAAEMRELLSNGHNIIEK